MSDPWLYSFPSPLEGFKDLIPLSSEKVTEGPDAKSLINDAPGARSEAYSSFVGPITNGARAGFDVHIYFLQTNATETRFAKELNERIRLPELRIYSVFEKPVGPHPMGMFEVNIHTPEQFGAFVPWLVINRGPLSALVHPNTGDDVRDHTQRATWMGQPVSLHVGMLRDLLKEEKAKAIGS